MNLLDDATMDIRTDVRIRQELVLVALGRLPADLSIRVGRLLSVHCGQWLEDQEIVIRGRRIAWVGPAGGFRGKVAHRVDRSGLSAVPGFGEVHKHIESTHLTPEHEAALVIPGGNTWTCEASHELGNVNGARNVEFWQTARRHGSPLKVFIQPGSAVPPSAWEETGGCNTPETVGGELAAHPEVVSLDEVMDWPAVWNPANPSYDRMWGLIGATLSARGVVEGHASGLVEAHDVSAFAATGISSDHEAWSFDDAWAKLQRGLFIELRPFSFDQILPGLLRQGLRDWSHVAFTTDDRSASDTLRLGSTDHNVRSAIAHGIDPETAIQCVTINPARHMRVDQWVGSLAPGRYADVVLLEDVGTVRIAEVYADGALAAVGSGYVGPMPRIRWPAWTTQSMRIGRPLSAADFAIRAPDGRGSVTAAVMRPFHWNQDLLHEELSVLEGDVQRDAERNITKFAVVDRHLGTGKVGRMFWRGCGPRDPDTALACSVAHDSHNVWSVGSSDAAMACAVNRLQVLGGGWVLVRDGVVAAEVRLEVAGLMTARPAAKLDHDMQLLYAAAREVDWIYEANSLPTWTAGFPEKLIFATLTCTPWRWVLIAPTASVPTGLVNVQTGETSPVVW